LFGHHPQQKHLDLKRGTVSKEKTGRFRRERLRASYHRRPGGEELRLGDRDRKRIGGPGSPKAGKKACATMT